MLVSFTGGQTLGLRLSVVVAVVLLSGCGGSGQPEQPVAASGTYIPPSVSVTPRAVVTEHVITYGASVSMGEHSTVNFPTDLSVPLDAENVGYMFVGGTRPEDLSSLVTFEESNRMDTPQLWNCDYAGETPLFGALSQMQGLGVRLIGSAAGRAGSLIADLSKGTTPYTRLLAQVTAGQALSPGPYSVAGLIWIEGRNDAGNTAYAGQFAQLVMDLDHDIRAITNQTNPLQIYVCLPLNAPDIAAAQTQVSQNMPQIHIVCDTTNFPKVSDGVHLTAASEKQVGELMGAAIVSEETGVYQ
jgi:hypothetical protein